MQKIIIDTVSQTFIVAFDFLSEILPLFVFAVVAAALILEFVPDKLVEKLMGKATFSNVFFSTLIGALIPLCSCGMIPLAIALRKKGADWFPLLSFLTSGTALSILALILTSPLGVNYVILRFLGVMSFAPLVAYFTVLILDKSRLQFAETDKDNCECHTHPDTKKEPANRFLKFIQEVNTIIREYVPSIFVAILIASLLAVLIPQSYVISLMGNDAFLSPFLTSLIGLPIYLCAGSEVPLAKSLIEKGASISSVLALMLAAPNVNLTTYFMYSKWIGKKQSIIYLVCNWLMISVVSIIIYCGYIGYVRYY